MRKNAGMMGGTTWSREGYAVTQGRRARPIMPGAGSASTPAADNDTPLGS